MKTTQLFDRKTVILAFFDAIKKCTPQAQWRNPVMFIVYVGALLTTGIWITSWLNYLPDDNHFTSQVMLWLWVTLLFANFAESLAESRSKAQAASLRGAKQQSKATRLLHAEINAPKETVDSFSLHKGDIVLVNAGETIPCDGEVIEGGASVDESAITGESAPVIRESGGDFSSVTGGTRVLSDWLIIRCTAEAGNSFLDRMIGMVEGAKRRKTPNEIALTILLTALTLIFLLACITLYPFSVFAVEFQGHGDVISVVTLIAFISLPYSYYDWWFAFINWCGRHEPNA